MPGQFGGGGAGGERDRGPRPDQLRGTRRDGRLLGLLTHRLRLESRLVGGPGDGGAAVHLGEQAAFVQQVQVAADGHVGDAELGGQLADAYAAGHADPVEDRRMALLREHRPLPDLM
ncbi:hypothetical protein GCM10029963_58020 [Micromonospora andamanensis]